MLNNHYIVGVGLNSEGIPATLTKLIRTKITSRRVMAEEFNKEFNADTIENDWELCFEMLLERGEIKAFQLKEKYQGECNDLQYLIDAVNRLDLGKGEIITANYYNNMNKL